MPTSHVLRVACLCSYDTFSAKRGAPHCVDLLLASVQSLLLTGVAGDAGHAAGPPKQHALNALGMDCDHPYFRRGEGYVDGLHAIRGTEMSLRGCGAFLHTSENSGPAGACPCKASQGIIPSS